MKNKVLFLSGGGTKIVFLASVALHLIRSKKLHFQHYVGVSAGSLISIMLAMRKYDELETSVLDTKTSDIFRYNPKSFIGTFLALWNVLSGKTYLYDDSALKNRLKKMITKDQFERYIKDPNTPKCYIICVDVNNGKELLIDIKKQNYYNAINYILASTAIPVFVGHKIVNGRKLYDGGLRSHIGAATWLRKHIDQINECYSVYSRPQDLENITWIMPKPESTKRYLLIVGLIYSMIIGPFLSSINLDIGFLNQTVWTYANILLGFGIMAGGLQFNIVKLLDRIIEIMNLEISKSDEKESDLLCYGKLKRNEKIFAPYKLLDNAYSNTPEDNKKMWNLGVEAVEENPNLWKSI